MDGAGSWRDGELIVAIEVIVTLGSLAQQILLNTSQLENNMLTAKAAAVNAGNIGSSEPRAAVESIVHSSLEQQDLPRIAGE